MWVSCWDVYLRFAYPFDFLWITQYYLFWFETRKYTRTLTHTRTLSPTGDNLFTIPCGTLWSPSVVAADPSVWADNLLRISGGILFGVVFIVADLLRHDYAQRGVPPLPHVVHHLCYRPCHHLCHFRLWGYPSPPSFNSLSRALTLPFTLTAILLTLTLTFTRTHSLAPKRAKKSKSIELNLSILP